MSRRKPSRHQRVVEFCLWYCDAVNRVTALFDRAIELREEAGPGGPLAGVFDPADMGRLAGSLESAWSDLLCANPVVPTKLVPGAGLN